MEADFWHQRWEDNVIGFHLSEPNPLLVQHIESLGLKKGSRLLIPLCGKTLDIGWLLSLGYRVVGVELSQIAVNQLFEQLGINPQRTDLGDLIHYSADGIDMFVGDVFHLSQQILGPVDAVYDRAALIALPKSMRERYAMHIVEMSNHASQLLVSLEYDQSALDGPPFSISTQELNQHYQQAYDIKLLASETVAGGLKGKCPATENVWLLKQVPYKRMFNTQSIALPPRGRWKKMLPLLIAFVALAWLVSQYDVNATVAAGGAVLVGVYTGLVTWLLGIIAMVPIIGPLLVKILTMSFIWLLNAIGYLVAYIAIKRGYSKDVLTYRGLTIALIVGMVIGYVIGRL